MDTKIILLLSVLGLQYCLGENIRANNHHNNHVLCGHGHFMTDCATLVDSAIVDVELYYDDHLCHEIVHIDCAQHTIAHDEVVCGSDGTTYSNHCLFTKARCQNLVDNGKDAPAIHMVSAGKCPVTAAPQTTAVPIVSSQAPAASSQAPLAPLVSSQAPVQTTTTALPTTTNAVTTTMDSLHSVIASVFCQHASTVDCNTGFNVVCGSDGQYYPNDCELSKAKCLNPILVKAEAATCNP